jgi:hypothetical protein
MVYLPKWPVWFQPCIGHPKKAKSRYDTSTSATAAAAAAGTAGGGWGCVHCCCFCCCYCCCSLQNGCKEAAATRSWQQLCVATRQYQQAALSASASTTTSRYTHRKPCLGSHCIFQLQPAACLSAISTVPSQHAGLGGGAANQSIRQRITVSCSPKRTLPFHTSMLMQCQDYLPATINKDNLIHTYFALTA